MAIRGEVSSQQWGDATQAQSVLVDDIVCFAHKVWVVTGVHLGALGQESVATIIPYGRTNPHVYGEEIRECIVPLPFLYGRVYRYVKPGKFKPKEPADEAE